MNPLRALADLVFGRIERSTSDQQTCRWRAEQLHHGPWACNIADHHDAIRLAGQMTAERDEWRRRALAAETKLRHPAAGAAEQQTAA